MKSRHLALKVAVASALVVLAMGLTARPASAGWPYGRRVVVATPAYPTAVIAAPVVVSAAPIATVYPAPLEAVATAPVFDSALVPTAFAAPTVVSAPVVTTYAVPAVIATPVRGRVVYPRRVYRFGY